MNAITHREESASLVTADASAILAVSERAARDPAVDIEKMERLMAMAERMAERQAKADYNAALAEMQPNLPIVERRGMISVPAKDNKTGHDTPYALWEDVNEAIRPMLAEHGFALSFRVGKDSDRVVVTGVLSHRGGHSEETTLSLPMDTTGSKNNVQAIGSSVSYGKRYTAGALLNLTSRGEDDDGKQGGGEAIEDGEAKITGEQESTLIDAIEDCKIGRPKFCTHYKIDMVAQLPARLFDEAIKACADYKAKREKK